MVKKMTQQSMAKQVEMFCYTLTTQWQSKSWDAPDQNNEMCALEIYQVWAEKSGHKIAKDAG